VRKVRAAFAEKGVANELVPVDIFDPPPDFQTISPLRRIPVLEFVGGPERAPLADSSAIVVYLEAAHPEPSLFPADPYDRGRAVWIEEYADTVLAYQLGIGDAEWYAGPAYSIADLAVAAQMSGLVLVDCLDILDSYPNLARLLDQARRRPAFAAAVEEALAVLH